MFYEFSQNNSGGRFTEDDFLCHKVVIEASDKNEAIDKAKDMGVYFNGVDDGIDCPCCGDRWSEPDEVTFPKTYNEIVYKTPKKYYQMIADAYGWTSPDIRIYYRNRKIMELYSKRLK